MRCRLRGSGLIDHSPIVRQGTIKVLNELEQVEHWNVLLDGLFLEFSFFEVGGQDSGDMLSNPVNSATDQSHLGHGTPGGVPNTYGNLENAGAGPPVSLPLNDITNGVQPMETFHGFAPAPIMPEVASFHWNNTGEIPIVPDAILSRAGTPAKSVSKSATAVAIYCPKC